MKRVAHPGVRLRLPATSANLGPGFDAVGLALSMHLSVEAVQGKEFAIRASGRDAALCGSLEGNLILDTYRDVLGAARRVEVPWGIKLHNEIPLGMGCGSSAAALLAGVALANHFGDLGWSDEEIVAEASRREGHPDNVAACWWGGFTVSAAVEDGVRHATFAGWEQWDMLLALPAAGLATRTARALLPEQYSRADAVFNVQRVALLTAAFAQGRLDLLRAATEDRMHQPYRGEVCPLLPLLLLLREEREIAGVTLSGAGPSVLVFLSEGVTPLEAETRLRKVLPAGVEILGLRIAEGATVEPL